MPDYKQFRLPDVGEGLTEADILSWHVQPGETVTLNQIVCEIETAKAAVELPSPFAGTVTKLHFPVGATVDVGTPIITIDIDPSGAPLDGPQVLPPDAPPETVPPRDDLTPQIPLADDDMVEPGLIGGPAPGGRTSVLVGYGPRSVAAKRRPRKQPAGTGPRGEAGTAPVASTGRPDALRSAPAARPGEPPAPAGSGGTAAGGAAAGGAAAGSGGTAAGGAMAGGSAAGSGGAAGGAAAAPNGSTPAAAPRGADVAVLAKPPVRKLAKDLGVDLRSVTGTGANGVVTRADVTAAAQGGDAVAEPVGVEPAAAGAPAPVWDASRERRVPVRGVRKHTAAAMVASAFTAPHVTVFLTADVTPMMELRKRIAARPEFAGIKVSPLLLVAKALLLAVRQHPMVNSSWDEAAQEIVVKEYVNLGIAAATPRGLVVPNIKDAGRLPLRDLAAALAELTGTARAGKSTPADLSGGTITVSNVGVFGVDTGTPILNPGESAILAFGAVREAPWVVDGQLAVRQVAQLSLSFDHRIIDGQQGSEFLAAVTGMLSDPTTAFLWA
jgi:2-oxoisovalerate dehydrogenase E2 component (dihydrolipoyl transacylase)